MGALTDIWKRSRKAKHVQRVHVPIDQWIEEGKPFVLYLGNGADGICYKQLFEERRLKGAELCRNGERGSDEAYQEVVESSCPVPVVQGFTSTEAEFAGFWARKKKDGRWHWYIKGAGFCPLTEQMEEKQLFWDGDDIRALFSEEGGYLVLQAQWRRRTTGKAVRNGYPMLSHTLQAHAFGAFEGHTYCNTLAAYQNGVQNGYRYFEVDLSYTADRRLVCCHGWTESACKNVGFAYSERFLHMRYRWLKKMKVYGQEIMDVRQFYREMKKRPQDTFEIDFHEVYGEDLKRRIHALLKDFAYDTEALERLVIQAYSMQMYQEIDAIYHFKHYQYLVGDKTYRLDEILEFCLDHNIGIVAMRGSMTAPEMVRKIQNAGLYLMCYTVKQDADFAKYLLDMGADTICTDSVTAEALLGASDCFGPYPFSVVYLSNAKQGPQDTEPHACPNDGEWRIAGDTPEKEGCVFAGWNLRVTIDGSRLWYGTDGLYHAGRDFNGKTELAKRLFLNGERLPVLLVKEGMTAELAAAWKKL